MTPEEGRIAAQLGVGTPMKGPEPAGPTIAMDQSSGGRLGEIAAALVYSPQAQALGRQGRDDLINTLWVMPTAEAPGAPGQPTQGIITSEIKEQEHDIDMD